MAFTSRLRRVAALFLPLVAASCTPARWVPPATVGAIPADPDRQLLGRVGEVEAEPLGRVGQSAYAPPRRQNGGSAGIDYLDTPNLAGTGPSAMGAAPAGETEVALTQSDGALPPIDGGYPEAAAETKLPPIDGGYEEAPTLAAASLPPIDGGYDEAPAATVAGGPLEVTEEGVNMDAGLGVATGAPRLLPLPGTVLVEGETDQPVVDGIGTDNPVTLQAAR